MTRIALAGVVVFMLVITDAVTVTAEPRVESRPVGHGLSSPLGDLDEHQVRVMCAGEPVAGVIVHVFDRRALSAEESRAYHAASEARSRETSRFEIARPFAKSYTTDARGLVRVETFTARYLEVFAEKGELRGHVRAKNWSDVDVIELIRPVDIDVRVVDRNRKPVGGVRVGLDAATTLSRPTDAATGETRIRCDGWSSHPSRFREPTWKVSAHGLFTSRPSVEVRRDRQLREPVVIVLPPYGSVTMHLREPNGEPSRTRVSGLLIDPKGIPLGVPGHVSSRSKPDQVGVVCFPLVGLGLALQARATDGAARFESVTCDVAGPTTDRENIDVVMTWRKPMQRLVGTLVDATERPMPSTPFDYRIFQWGPDNDPYGARGGEDTTDAEGRFELSMVTTLVDVQRIEFCVSRPGKVSRKSSCIPCPIPAITFDVGKVSF